MEYETAALLSRIERLERSNARQRALSFLSLAVCTVLALTAASPPNKSITLSGSSGHSILITGDYISLRDSSKSRISLGFSKFGDPSLTMRDAAGKTRLIVGLPVGGADIEMYDDAGTERAYLGAFTSGNYGGFFADSGASRYWHQP